MPIWSIPANMDIETSRYGRFRLKQLPKWAAAAIILLHVALWEEKKKKKKKEEEDEKTQKNGWKKDKGM